MRSVSTVVVHCADTPDGYGGYTAQDIDAWHGGRGFRRRPEAMNYNPSMPYIGYHRVIGSRGELWNGRAVEEAGAHCRGHNYDSLGVCLMGRTSFRQAQWDRLAAIVAEWQRLFGPLEVVGHRDLDAGKECPGFDVRSWLSGGMVALMDHMVEE